MNNVEPPAQDLANMQLQEPSRPLPEQTQSQRPILVPRPISFLSVIHQWQPMGIRVTVNLPFVGDDKSTLFCIRNGPFIPDPCEAYFNSEGKSILEFAFNAMNAVVQTDPYGSNYPKNYPVHISYYDSPPFLSQISRCFRRWRGDMQYRLRIVSGFVTQGYIIISTIKNSPLAISKMDEFNQFYNILDIDNTSYRSKMQNAYLMSDVSMYRHVEVTYPYEYPTPWYDQYQWIANRVDILTTDKNDDVLPARIQEPFADNWLAVFFRGALEPTRDTSQMSFELEYRAMEGFQFADPNLPPYNIHRVRTNLPNYKLPSRPVLTIPSTKWTSDGINSIRPAASGLTNILNGPTPGTQVRPAMRRAGRVHRDADVEVSPSTISPTTGIDESAVTEGEDTVDQRTPSQRRRDAEFSY